MHDTSHALAADIRRVEIELIAIEARTWRLVSVSETPNDCLDSAAVVTSSQRR